LIEAAVRLAAHGAEAGFDGTHIAEGDVMCRENPAILDQLAQTN
jgi:hypothetical protein